MFLEEGVGEFGEENYGESFASGDMTKTTQTFKGRVEEVQLDIRQVRSRITSAPSPKVFCRMLTSNQEMQKIFAVVEKVAQTKSTVLILGESGTGKELIAKAVHELSGVRGAFVPVNCGAIPDNLLESELFGYEKGAFTGAQTSKPGRFQMAEGGTIFLDEIGEMSPHLQVKLLRVLQDKVVEPVGGTRSKAVNVRIVAATNVNLRQKVEEGTFREDLFYRLQVVPVELPPLRERAEDIELLIEHFARAFASDNQTSELTFSQEALQAMTRYRWAGNIRELENLVERLAIMVDSGVVEVDDLPTYLLEESASKQSLGIFSQLPRSGVDFNLLVESFENDLILKALERTRGNKTAAADLLSLNRTTLVEKIKKKGLERLIEQEHI